MMCLTRMTRYGLNPGSHKPKVVRGSRQVAVRAKDDAAKKALKEMFEGKKDFLAAYDKPPPGDGGDGGKGGGKDGDPFAWFGEWFDGFKKGFAGLLKTLASLAILGLIAVGMANVHHIGSLLKVVFRLNGRPQAARTAPVSVPSADVEAGKVSQSEADLMAKYGADTDDVYTGDDEEK